MLLRLIHLSIVLLSVGHLQAQEVIATDGNYAATIDGSLSWTLGEIVTETFSLTDHLTQGFQQNYEDFVSVDELGQEIILSVFPNPFQGEITLQVSDALPDYQITVLDYQSKILFEQEVFFPPGVEDISIDLSDLSEGYYILRIEIPEQFMQTIRSIVKVN
jgi:hypothetical protein